MITSHNQNLLPRAVCAKLSQTSGTLGSISVALSCLVSLVYPPREESSGRSAGSFPEQRLVIEPTGTFVLLLQWCSIHLSCFGNFPRYTMQFAISKLGGEICLSDVIMHKGCQVDDTKESFCSPISLANHVTIASFGLN